MASPPFNPNEALPTDTGVVSLFPSQERTFRDIMESWMLWEHDRSGYHKFTMGTTVSRLAASTLPAGALWWDTTLNALYFVKSIGPLVFDALSFPAGTRMLFQQTAAPAGWTKVVDTAYDNVALRLVVGTVSSGGTVDFDDAFASQDVVGTVGDTVLTEAEMPAHSHFVVADAAGGTNPAPTNANQVAQNGSGSDSVTYSLRGVATAATIGLTSEAGESEAHTHSFTGTDINLAVKYRDVILAVKD